MDPDSSMVIPLLSVGSPKGGTDLLLYILILVLLVIVNGFFAASEMAMVTINDAKLKVLAEEGNRRAQSVQKLLNQPTKFLASIQVGVTVASFFTSAVAADRFSEPITSALSKVLPSLNQSFIHAAVLIVFTLLLAIVSIVFGEMIPKRIAMIRAEKISLAFVPLLTFFYHLSSPIIFILSKLTAGILKIFGINSNEHSEEVTEEEIMMMVDVGKESGVIEEKQKDMIAGVFEFDDTTADEVMTHRTEVVALRFDCSIQDVIKCSVDEGYSRIPIYKDDLDDIIGIVYVKDLLKYVGKNLEESVSIKQCMRPALYIPESVKLREVFTKLTENKMQIAVVVDEYGGTAGLITMEDVLESIVGQMQDEYDDEEEEIAKVSDTVFTIEGTAPLDEAAKLLSITVPKDVEYDTVGGFITGLLERIPVPGENPEVEFDNVKFTVLEVEDRRISSVRAEKLPCAEEKENQD